MAVRLDGPDPVLAVGVQIVDDNEKYTVEKFRKNGAEVFVGGADHIKAESWIDIMEKAFKALSVPSRHQTRLTTCML